MEGFIQKYQQNVTGVLNGWDRLRFRGTLRALAVVGGMMNYLRVIGVLLKDFGGFVEQASQQVKSACMESAARLGRPVRYMPSSQTRKEDVALAIARADGIAEGLIGLLTCVESCMTYSIRRDPAKTQSLMDRLLRWDWPTFLGAIAQRVHPVLPEILRGYRVDYYGSACESEWASDVMFRSPSALASIYPALARGAITAFDSSNVLRFLGKRPEGYVRADVTSDYRRRIEGVRVKHAVGSNSVKMYDKQGSVLRVETTINDPRQLRVYRRKEGDADGPMDWHKMRKGVADLRRRAEVSQGCNQRYLDALATLDTSTPLRELIEPICRPTSLGHCRLRAMRPWSGEDLALLRAINRAEFALNGFRNRDLVEALHGALPPEDKRRVSAKTGHRLRLLRGHHLVKKVAHTHRYQLTAKGCQIVTAILQTQEISLAKLAQIAA